MISSFPRRMLKDKKRKLMFEGMSEKEASEQIATLLETVEKNKGRKKPGRKKNVKKEFDESFQKMKKANI